MTPQPQVPSDFGARVRAARRYLKLSQTDFAPLLGMSLGYVKNLEGGKSVQPQEFRGLVGTLVEITGMDEEFFTQTAGAKAGEVPEPTQLDRIEDALKENMEAIESLAHQLRTASAATATSVAGVIERIGEAEQAIRSSLPPQRQAGSA